MKRMVKDIEDAKSESGGTGALKQMKTGGKGRIRRQGSDGGRDGLIGGDGKVLSNGHGHGHGQEHEHEHLSSVAAPLGSSPVARLESTTVLIDTVLTTTPAATTTNIAPDSIFQNIDDTLDIFDIPIPEFPKSRRPHDNDHDHVDGSSDPGTTPSGLITDSPYSPPPGLPPVGVRRLSEARDY